MRAATTNKLAQLRRVRAHFGVLATIGWTARRVISFVFGVLVNHFMWIEAGEAGMPHARLPLPYSCEILSVERIRALSADPANDIEAEFIDRAARGHDLCIAIFHGDALASYTWIALDCIEPQHCGGAPLSFPADVAYVYKAFTLPRYRGQHLREHLFQFQRQVMAERGVHSFVCIVDWANFASLKNSRRTGYRTIGRLVSLKLGSRRRWLYLSDEPQRRGIRYGHQADMSPRRAEAPDWASVAVS